MTDIFNHIKELKAGKVEFYGMYITVSMRSLEAIIRHVEQTYKDVEKTEAQCLKLQLELDQRTKIDQESFNEAHKLSTENVVLKERLMLVIGWLENDAKRNEWRVNSIKLESELRRVKP